MVCGIQVEESFEKPAEQACHQAEYEDDHASQGDPTQALQEEPRRSHDGRQSQTQSWGHKRSQQGCQNVERRGVEEDGKTKCQPGKDGKNEKISSGNNLACQFD